MKNKKLPLSIYFFIVTYFFLASSCNERRIVSFSQVEVQELDSMLFDITHSLPVPAVAVAVIKDNKIYYKAMGKTQMPGGLPVTDSTFFFAGTLSEPMVATAIMKLVDAKRIKLDDPVIKYLPYFKLGDNSYKNITIKHLLTHTSGLPHHAAIWDTPYNNDDALEMTTRSIHLQQPLFKPAGSRIKRNPYNYDILADLIAKVNKTSFEEYMKAEVFIPLGMIHSTFYKADIAKNMLAQPHQIKNWLTYEIQKEVTYPYNREHAGSIGLNTSIKDLSSWMYMILNNGKTNKGMFFDEKIGEELISMQFKATNAGGIGLGWEINKAGKDLVFSKNHQLGGFSADMRLIPDKKIGVLIISNIAGDFDQQVISEKIIRWLNGSKFTPIRTPINIPMGKTLANTGSLDSAFNLYTKLQKNTPNQYNFSEESLSQLGVNLFYRLDRKSDAISVYRFCVKQNPNSAYSYLNLAEAYMLQKDTVRAREAFAMITKFPIDKSEMLPRLNFIEEMLKPGKNQPITN